MIIKRLHIDSFGVFENEQMTGIGPRINILGGPNRAGKTTLMQVLRYLGYPLPREEGVLPPAIPKHRFSATVVDESGQEYRIQRAGQAEPSVSSMDNGEVAEISQLYSVDEFTYRQLFTISLDELRRLPQGVRKSDASELQSVLLGAGLADVAQIPDIRDSFRRKAHNIGRKYGTRDVGEFKQFNEAIREAVKEREEARAQIEEYREKRGLLETVRKKIAEAEQEIQETEYYRDRLDFLQQQFENYHELQSMRDTLAQEEPRKLLEYYPAEDLPLAERLEERYAKVCETVKKSKQSFLTLLPETRVEQWREYMHKLVENRDQLKHWDREFSGLRERIREFTQSREEHVREGDRIASKLSQVNAGWTNNFSAVEEIQTDTITIGNLRKEVADYQQLQGKEADLQKEIADIETRIESLEAERDNLEAMDIERLMKRSLIAGAAILLLAILLGIWMQPWLGIVAGIVGGLTVGARVLITYLMGADDRRRANELSANISGWEADLEEKREEYQTAENELSAVQEKLSGYRERLGLNEDVYLQSLPDYYQDVADLKSAIGEWNRSRTRLEEQKAGLKRELDTLRKLLQELTSAEIDEVEPDSAGPLFDHLERTLEHLETAEPLHELVSEQRELEEQIVDMLSDGNGQIDFLDQPASPDEYQQALQDYLSQGERYRQYREIADQSVQAEQTIVRSFTGTVLDAFTGGMGEQAPDDPEAIIDLLDKHYAEFVSKDAVHEKLQVVRGELAKQREELESHRDRESRLDEELRRLATSERLRRAEEKMDRARSRLEPLAREYAVNRIAALILQELHDRFIEQTREELLSGASEVFRRLTSGAYSEIGLTDQVVDADFVSVTDEGKSLETTNYLSRGTQEQLFLAVRLSRIREVDPPLPVILDDSLVNFDMAHRKNAAQIVADLADRNQVFVLTCHPEIVHLLAETDVEISYWTIDAGRIAASDFEGVIDLLN